MVRDEWRSFYIKDEKCSGKIRIDQTFGKESKQVKRPDVRGKKGNEC